MLVQDEIKSRCSCITSMCCPEGLASYSAADMDDVLDKKVKRDAQLVESGCEQPVSPQPVEDRGFAGVPIEDGEGGCRDRNTRG